MVILFNAWDSDIVALLKLGVANSITEAALASNVEDEAYVPLPVISGPSERHSSHL